MRLALSSEQRTVASPGPPLPDRSPEVRKESGAESEYILAFWSNLQDKRSFLAKVVVLNIEKVNKVVFEQSQLFNSAVGAASAHKQAAERRAEFNAEGLNRHGCLY